MQLLREFNALTALSYNLAFDGKKVINQFVLYVEMMLLELLN